MSHQIISVVHALQLVHDGLKSRNQQDQDDAESLLSAVVLHLRNKQAILPEELALPVKRLERRHSIAV